MKCSTCNKKLIEGEFKPFLGNNICFDCIKRKQPIYPTFKKNKITMADSDIAWEDR